MIEVAEIRFGDVHPCSLLQVQLYEVGWTTQWDMRWIDKQNVRKASVDNESVVVCVFADSEGPIHRGCHRVELEHTLAEHPPHEFEIFSAGAIDARAGEPLTLLEEGGDFLLRAKKGRARFREDVCQLRWQHLKKRHDV
jgi:hypothetical protein